VFNKDTEILDDYDVNYLKNSDLVIGFYSTDFQTAILQRTPIIMLQPYYSLETVNSVFKDYDLEFSPVKRIGSNNELMHILSQVFSSGRPYDEILNTLSLYNWYKSFYNYPDGLYDMFHVLNEQ
jgi:hypothetical protein